MITFLQTLLYFILTLSIASIAGYGMATLFLPAEFDEYRYILLPVLGYPSIILTTHFISGSLQISVLQSSLISFALLAGLSVCMFWKTDRHSGLVAILRSCTAPIILSVPMLLVVLWPMFYVGAKTFLAAVNPDFFLGLADNVWLKSHPTNLIKGVANTDAFDIFYQISGTISESARYRGAYIAILLDGLFHIPQRTGLTLTIALFHYCMPPSLYFFVRTALRQNRFVAYLSACLLGFSSSIALGYLSYYIGQASALGFLPVTMAMWFIALTRPAFRSFFLAAFLSCAMWVMYLGLMPYAGGPILLFSVYLLVTRQLRVRVFLAMAFGAIALLFLIHLRMMPTLLGVIRAWVGLAGNTTLLGQYYTDFVTERFFPMFYGLTIYTLESSVFRSVLGYGLYGSIVFTLSVTISLGLIAAIVSWMRSKDRQARVFGALCVATYAGAAANFIFIHPYGYGAFKNGTWLQFMLVSIAAIGIWRSYEILIGPSRGLVKVSVLIIFSLTIAPFVFGNITSSLEYGYKSLGIDTNRGYIVILHNTSGNEDYFHLASELSRIVKPNESVGISFINSAQNEWVSYYLRQFKLSYLGQYLIPGDDENLPDVVSRRVVDTYGNVTIDSPTFFHGSHDSYYLVNNQGVLNAEIVNNKYPRILWQDRTFSLVRSSDTPDFMYVGRGFYRAEFRNAKDYYVPSAMRWTAEGGELYILRAGKPGRPYRLALTGQSGPGLRTAVRTLEFYHNRKLFGTSKIINGFGRIISDPFYPTGDVDFLVFRIKEKVVPPRRRFALWHKDLPTEYRRLNLAVSNIELITPDETEDPIPLNEVLHGSSLFTKSIEFNGIEPNEWVREEMMITLPRTPQACSIAVSVYVPNHPRLQLPEQIRWRVDGNLGWFPVMVPGEQTLRIPVATGSASRTVTIELKPDHFLTPDGYDASERPVVQSVRLDGISFLGCTKDAR